MNKKIVIIPAAGIGERFNYHKAKQYYKINEKTILEHTIGIFKNSPKINLICVNLAQNDNFSQDDLIDIKTSILERCFDNKECSILFINRGGKTRNNTVKNCLNYLYDHHLVNDDDWVIVHDAVRCNLKTSMLDNFIFNLENDEVGGFFAVPVQDTLKKIDNNTIKTISRDNMWHAQTPQMFRASILKSALNQNKDFTDEASAVENLGFTPKLILGDKNNIKITTFDDINIIEYFFNNNENHDMEIKIGQGYDVHKLENNRKLIIGGVNIPFSKGLIGHSDADVLIHAIIDAILGALAKGDIGMHFADNDILYKNIDSRKLLKKIFDLYLFNKWDINNIDCTIIAQKPKLQPYILEMKENIADILSIEIEKINIKAKTNENLGYIGREEAIETQSIVLLRKIS